MTDTEEIVQYQNCLENGLHTLCDAVEMDPDYFDGDEDDFTLYKRCFEMMAGALKEHGVFYDAERGEFRRKPGA